MTITPFSRERNGGNALRTGPCTQTHAQQMLATLISVCESCLSTHLCLQCPHLGLQRPAGPAYQLSAASPGTELPQHQPAPTGPPLPLLRASIHSSVCAAFSSQNSLHRTLSLHFLFVFVSCGHVMQLAGP